MIKSYRRMALALSFLLIWMVSSGLAEPSQPTGLQNLVTAEELGFEIGNQPQNESGGAEDRDIILLDSLPNFNVLLIPNSTSGSRGVYVYDPFDGTYLGTFVLDEVLFTTPICAIPGPDGNIYVSDQVEDAVHVFDRQGNFVQTYADAGDGLDNIRGIAFRDDHLFVTSGDAYLAEFDGPHSRLPDFVSGVDCFDVLFLENGSALVADIGGTDNVRLYDAAGNFVRTVFNVNFPEQINTDPEGTGTHLNASFSANIITDFDTLGGIEATTPWSSGRGIYRLGNGNYLATNGNGVFEIDPVSGAVIEEQNTGSGRFIELCPPSGGGGDADIEVSPTSLVETVSEGGSVTRDLFVANTGASMLRYGVHDDQAWIIIVADTGDVAPAGVDSIEVLFNSAGLSPGTYSGRINVTSNDPDEPSVAVACTLTVQGGGGLCDYIPGNINGVAPANGIDVTYGVTYLKGGAVPPNTCPACPQPAPFYAAMDVNGSCTTNGIDITYFVGYLKGGPALLYCPTCPPNIR
jgi:hypothetical protein